MGSNQSFYRDTGAPWLETLEDRRLLSASAFQELPLAEAETSVRVTLRPNISRQIGPILSAVLATPSAVDSISVSNTEIRLSWTDRAVGEAAYLVEKSTDNGVTFTSAGVALPDRTTAAITGLSPDTRYTFRVQAVSTTPANSSVWSSSHSNTTLPTFSKTVWVVGDYTGSSQRGTFDEPYTRISQAMLVAGAGDGVVIREGTYREKITVKSGTGAAPFTIMGLPNERAIISGRERLKGWQSVGGGVYKTNLNWKPTDLFVQDSPQPLSISPNSGFYVTPSANTTSVTDATRLAGIASLVGGYIQVHTAAGNNWSGREILTHDTTTGRVTFATVSGLANNDKYFIKNKLSLLDRPGEWAVVTNSSTSYDVYFRPQTTADLKLTESPKMDSRMVFANGAQYASIRNLEVTGGRGYGIEVTGDSHHITLKGNVVHNNQSHGFWVRYADDIQVLNNVAFANKGNGIVVSSTNNTVVEGNESAYNLVDAMIISGDVSGRTPGSAGFRPSNNVTVRNNYFHHQLGYGHTDGVQMYRYVYDAKILNNVIAHSSQNFISEEVDGAEFGGNLVLNSGSFTVRFEHGNSNNWYIHNNTIGQGAYGPYTFTGSDYRVEQNVTLGRVNIGSVTGDNYTGDYNFYSPDASNNVLRTSTPSRNYTSAAAFYADTGQEQHSRNGNPQFINAPLISTIIDRQSEAELNRIYIRNAANFAVGDHIEFNGDGVVRTITDMNVGAKRMTFDVPMSGLPNTYLIVENWKASTDFEYDYRLASGSVAATMGPTGGPVGSTLNWSDYRDGDFNGDGVRDIQPISDSIVAGMPNVVSWRPPSF